MLRLCGSLGKGWWGVALFDSVIATTFRHLEFWGGTFWITHRNGGKKEITKVASLLLRIAIEGCGA
jgi:hypothetical protein